MNQETPNHETSMFNKPCDTNNGVSRNRTRHFLVVVRTLSTYPVEPPHPRGTDCRRDDAAPLSPVNHRHITRDVNLAQRRQCEALDLNVRYSDICSCVLRQTEQEQVSTFNRLHYAGRIYLHTLLTNNKTCADDKLL